MTLIRRDNPDFKDKNQSQSAKSVSSEF